MPESPLSDDSHPLAKRDRFELDLMGALHGPAMSFPEAGPPDIDSELVAEIAQYLVIEEELYASDVSDEELRHIGIFIYGFHTRNQVSS